MEKEFITYNQALALKELVFDEPCFGYYDTVAVTYLTYPSAINKNSDIENSLSISKQDKNVRCSTPLYQQAFRWFREKHDLDKTIDSWTEQPMNDEIWDKAYQYHINGEAYHPYFKTYEEAESVCLDKLIEIVKKK